MPKYIIIYCIIRAQLLVSSECEQYDATFENDRNA